MSNKYSSDKGMQKLFEGFRRILNEEARKASFEHEGSGTDIEFLGMETKYDQTITKLRLNGEEQSFTAYDIDSLADAMIGNVLSEDDQYWFLNEDYGDEAIAETFKAKLMQTLEALGVDYEGTEEARNAYDQDGRSEF